MTDEQLDRIEVEARVELAERGKYGTFEIQDVLDLLAEIRALRARMVS